MPFSGGTGLSPLFPPNAPPAPKPLLNYINTIKMNKKKFPAAEIGELICSIIFKKDYTFWKLQNEHLQRTFIKQLINN